MEAFLRVYSAHLLTLQLHPQCFPLSTSNTSACPSMPWRTNASRSLTWVRKQRRSPALIHVTAFLNGDGGDFGHLNDEWYASHVKALLRQALKRWGLPVAVGAFVGSVIVRQAFIFVASSSFLLFMVALQVLEAQGGQLNSVSDVFSRHFLRALLSALKLIPSRVISYLPVALMACGYCLRRISMYIRLLLASTLAHLRSLVAGNKQGFLSQQGDLFPLDNKDNVAKPAFESQRKSTDSIIYDIDACIQKVEDMIQTDKGMPHIHRDMHWKQLRDNLTLLKVMVANVHLKGEGDNVFSNDAPVTAGSTVKGSQRRNRKQLHADKLQTNMIDKVFTGSTGHESKQDIMNAKPSELDIVGKTKDVSFLHSPHLTGKDAPDSIATLTSNGAALDQEYGSLSTELSNKGSLTSPTDPLDPLAPSRMGKSKSRSGLLSNESRPKYVDYWAQHNENGSALPSGSLEQKNEWHSSSSNHQREGSVMEGDQLTQGKYDFKSPSLYADRKNFWIDGPQLSGLIGGSDQEKVSSTILNSGKLAEQKAGGHEERHKPEKSIIDSKSNTCEDRLVAVESLDAEPTSLSRDSTMISNGEIQSRKHDTSKAESEKTRHKRFENRGSPSGFEKEQKFTQQIVNGSNQTNHEVEPNFASSGSAKELAFVRENPDMHVLTGFSRRRNDEEFQRLMTEGETAFRNGKAGLLGKIEVGEAETMLYKAADLFASAAAMDSSSVEALGFWGNTLLVHGELKLMLSRELRYMISTPDVISSYQIRRSRTNEMPAKSNQAALQQTFQSVCEECEELLIQAGRKYRMALSINNSEIRALYNWGLALCFRAQLIAEEGDQNACEAADKVYLAAIDKFEAIMGISRRYAPGAMLNWGLTLRDRSRLRPVNSTERIDLLQQAKQLFQDALRLQPDDAQIQSVLITCSVELKELQERKELQSKRSARSFFGNR